MTKTEPNKHLTMLWPDTPQEDPLLIEDEKTVVVLHQQEDKIYVNKNIIPELIKTLKQYSK